MQVGARDGHPLPTIDLPSDPNNPSRHLPHRAHVDFNRTRICVVPTSILLQWLYYRGIPMNRGSIKEELLQQVQRAIDIDQPLDKDCIVSDISTTARLYVSCDSISLLSSVEWETDGNRMLSLLRGTETPKINATYINEIFGEEMNGIRKCAWKHVVSDHLDVETLQFTQTRATIKGTETSTNIFEIKVTPSMKTKCIVCMWCLLRRVFTYPSYPGATVQMVGYSVVTHWPPFC